jgi:hypothetical protein
MRAASAAVCGSSRSPSSHDSSRPGSEAAAASEAAKAESHRTSLVTVPARAFDYHVAALAPCPDSLSSASPVYASMGYRAGAAATRIHVPAGVPFSSNVKVNHCQFRVKKPLV